MKQIFTLFGLLLAINLVVAQTNSPAISACTFGDNGLRVVLDESQICAADDKDALENLDSLGYHSGVNGFNNVVAWDAAQSAGTVAIPADTNAGFYVVTIDDLGAYYGVDASTITQVDFVFNQGPVVPVGEEWNNEGKAEIDGSCADFSAELAGLEACATTSLPRELKHLSLRVAPNPMADQAVVSFHNLNNDVFNVQLIGTNGQVVRTYAGVRGNKLAIEKAELTSGLYFVTFTNQEGQRAATSLMVR